MVTAQTRKELLDFIFSYLKELTMDEPDDMAEALVDRIKASPRALKDWEASYSDWLRERGEEPKFTKQQLLKWVTDYLTDLAVDDPREIAQQLLEFIKKDPTELESYEDLYKEKQKEEKPPVGYQFYIYFDTDTEEEYTEAWLPVSKVIKRTEFELFLDSEEYGILVYSIFDDYERDPRSFERLRERILRDKRKYNISDVTEIEPVYKHPRD